MNRSLVFVAFALLTWGFGEGLFFNFQPIYLKELGSDEQQIGLILGAFGAAIGGFMALILAAVARDTSTPPAR